MEDPKKTVDLRWQKEPPHPSHDGMFFLLIALISVVWFTIGWLAHAVTHQVILAP